MSEHKSDSGLGALTLWFVLVIAAPSMFLWSGLLVAACYGVYRLVKR
jgi:hypothetical protein